MARTCTGPEHMKEHLMLSFMQGENITPPDS
jgi:hypothetical protein